MNYSDLTFKDRNPVKRYLQRQRLKEVAKKRTQTLDNQSHLHILDFGCGNAELYKYLKESFPSFSYIGYDPSEKYIEEARYNVQLTANDALTFDKNEILDNKYDLIFSLEVFEHLPDDVMSHELDTLQTLLSSHGILVVAVPNELYLVALIRGLFRMTRRFGAYDATPKNVLRSTIGLPPTDRHKTLNKAGNYIWAHMGFDYRVLGKTLQNYFQVSAPFGSPFPLLPLLFNTEVNIFCRPKKQRS